MTANPYALAAELARPVAWGQLSRGAASAVLLLSALEAERRGPPHDPLEVHRGLCHVLDLHLAKQRWRRSLAEMRMMRRLRPLIALRKPRNVLAAEAHDVNGAEGFPFDEASVNDITAREVHFAARRQRHG